MHTELATAPQFSRRRVGIPLRVKLTLLGIAISAVPIGVVGFLLISVNQDALETSLREHFFTVIDSVSAEVEATVNVAESNLKVVSATLANDTLSISERIELIRSQVEAHDTLPWVAVYDAQGGLVDVVVKVEPTSAPQTLDPKLRKTAHDLGRAIAPASAGSPFPEALLVMETRGRGSTWFVATALLLEPAQLAIERFIERRQYQDHYTVYVVDENRRALAHSNRELAETLSSLENRPAFELIDGDAFENGLVLFRDRVGSGEGESVVAVSSMRTVPWALGVEIRRSVAYASFTQMRWSVFFVVLAVILIAVVTAVFFARRITQPITTLVSFANDLAARRFHRVHLKTRDELSILGDALSDAATELAASDEAMRREEAIRTDLGRYLPSQIVERIVSREANVKLGGERREITVLFADVANFTPLAEKHAAEDVVSLLNELFTILTEIVFRHDGTVDKFIGDCVMAFWGAPSPQPDHARRALAAAEDMLNWLEIGNQTWKERFGIEIKLAIGVHTGEAVVGNFGSESRMEYTAIGDMVNVAARLETRARPQQILVSDATRQSAGDEFEFNELGSHALAGRTTDIELLEVKR